jgi:hypothetical protein
MNDYPTKFAAFIKMCAEPGIDVVLIHHPEVIGDNYDEMCESLNRLAAAGKKLVICPPAERAS